MGELIGIVIILAIFVLPGMITNYTFDHRLPPDGYRTDYGAMTRGT